MGKLPNLEINKKSQGYIMKKKMYIFIISLLTFRLLDAEVVIQVREKEGTLKVIVKVQLEFRSLHWETHFLV